MEYVKKTLRKLKDASLPIDIDKYEFYVYETKYLGLIIGANSIRMDLAKV